MIQRGTAANRWSVATATVAGLLLVACTTSPAPSAPTSPPDASASPVASAPENSSPPLITPAIGRIAAGYLHTCALTNGGGVRCWGSNSSGQLGDGTNADRSFPVDVLGLTSGVRAIAAGGGHTCALTDTGGVKCWGYNLYGQLGDDTNADSRVPVDVVGLTSGVTAISVGWSSTCALTDRGGVRCWGNNPFGGLGDGTRSDRAVPVDVQGLASGVSAISAGTLHACALTTGGGVKCWGYGQSPNPTLFTTYVPADVPGLAGGVTAIGAALDRTCALKDDAGVICWGPNYPAQPGNGVPGGLVTVDVSGLAGGVAALAVGEANTCVLTNGGKVACWGSNEYGQFGNLSPTSSSAPVAVAGLPSHVVETAVGGMHICALTNSGEVDCWGSNAFGQLGNVIPCSSTSVPVAVPLDGIAATPTATLEPSATPLGPIAHATGPKDVLLRLDRGPDLGASELGGEFFRPGPEFTLYGDGTVIFRNERAQPPPAEGPIIRAQAFMVARLDEEQIQSLLAFALGDGGLRDACERYETGELDIIGSAVYTVHAGGLDKRVEVSGSEAPLAALEDRIRSFSGNGSIPTTVWIPDRYWGHLLDATNAIEAGVLPDPRDAGIVPWPWPGIRPLAFLGPPDLGNVQGRRVMSAVEAAALGLSDNGGVVQRVYLLGPAGEATYSFSLWPMLPDETS